MKRKIIGFLSIACLTISLSLTACQSDSANVSNTNDVKENTTTEESADVSLASIVEEASESESETNATEAIEEPATEAISGDTETEGVSDNDISTTTQGSSSNKKNGTSSSNTSKPASNTGSSKSGSTESTEASGSSGSTGNSGNSGKSGSTGNSSNSGKSGSTSTSASSTTAEPATETQPAEPAAPANKTSSSEDLFVESGSGIYNYAPSVLTSGSTSYLFYCSNVTGYNVVDHICYRECTQQSDGTYVYSDKVDVLQPTSGSWDSVHVCDPSVIQGSFNYNGSNYKYLMAYLGCNTTNSQQNKIGLAVSNSLGGGWTKISANPIISIDYDYNHTDAFQWGVGQPSIISIDGGGNVLICYTQGTWNLTSEKAEVWNLSDLNNPSCLGSVTVSNSGTGDFISNADFAYSGGTLYMVCDRHPFSAGSLSNVSDSAPVYQTSISSLSDLGALESCTWTRVASIAPYNKNHNAGFFRDFHGNLASRNILYTKADVLSSFSDSLWTYRLKKAGF